MSDYIKREDAYSTLTDFYNHIREIQHESLRYALNRVPSADVAPVRHEEDGTLWVTVEDCETVGRVIVKNELGHFCRVFYMGEDDE